MNQIDQAIIDTLKVNMGYKQGESIAIILQEWHPRLGEENKLGYERSKEVCERMLKVYRDAGLDVSLFRYTPVKFGHGVDATQQLYENIEKKDIIFMPTATSLTHTKFTVTQSQKGSRIASMPTFTLKMFEPGGPMSADYNKISEVNKEIAVKLKLSDYVRITGPETEIVVQIDKELVHTDDGLILKPGEVGNLPGGEVYCVPVHEGNSNGHITLPKGWAGDAPLKCKTTFYIEQGRFVDIRGEDQEYIDKEVKPVVFGQKDFNILAELGIGTNINVTKEYVMSSGWSALTAEKIIGTAHFANGNSKAMGGKNDVPQHIDWVVPDVEIEYNYKPQ